MCSSSHLCKPSVVLGDFCCEKPKQQQYQHNPKQRPQSPSMTTEYQKRKLWLQFLLIMGMVMTIQGETLEAVYYSSVNITCEDPTRNGNDTQANLSSSDIRRVWILPNDEVVEAAISSEHARVEVWDGGSMLHVRRVDDVDFGWYLCVVRVTPGDTYLLYKHGLNVDGPYWGDLFQLKYRDMVITGAIAAAVCFVAMGLMCLAYNKQQVMLDKPPVDGTDHTVIEITSHDIPAKPSPTTHTSVTNTTNSGDGESSLRQKDVTQYDNAGYVTDRESSLPQTDVTQKETATSVVAEEMHNGKEKENTGTVQQELQNFADVGGNDASGNVTCRL